MTKVYKAGNRDWLLDWEEARTSIVNNGNKYSLTAKKKLAIIGSGVSGMSFAHLIKDKYEVELFEKDSRPGGLIKCDIVDGNLYHMVGGHVFNSKRQDVLDFFWSFFYKNKEFSESIRNAVAYLGKPVGYPIENHLYQMEPAIISSVIKDLIEIEKQGKTQIESFEDFLKNRFGKTLYKAYFKPYNEKIWKKELSKVPVSWLEGKLPMPTVEEIFFNNIKKEKEMKMVHSTFFYPRNNGSQFLADRLAEDLNIQLNTPVTSLQRKDNKWVINEEHCYDTIVFTGNIKYLLAILKGNMLDDFSIDINQLDYHGTTTVLCEIDKNDFSWIYMPDMKYNAHRIICTGNFSSNNNRKNILSATIEFTDYIDEKKIRNQLPKIPFSPRYITHRYTKYTYPIQNSNTRELICNIKKVTEPEGMYLLGRFAEWEYYNMDVAVGAALDLAKLHKI